MSQTRLTIIVDDAESGGPYRLRYCEENRFASAGSDYAPKTWDTLAEALRRAIYYNLEQRTAHIEIHNAAGAVAATVYDQEFPPVGQP